MTVTAATPPAVERDPGAGSTHVVVIGGGVGGGVAALRSAQLGARVTLIERQPVLGGTCVNWGCIPTKALLASADLLRRVRRASEFGIDVDGEVRVNFARMMERKEEAVAAMRSGLTNACKRRQVRVVQGPASVAGDAVLVGDERIAYDRLIVCVGTEPSGLPFVDMEHPRVLTSNDVLRLEHLPTSLLVIGGGVIGCEFASFFAPLGTAITVVEVLPQILAGVEPRVVTQFRRLQEKEGITFLCGRRLARVAAYREDGVTAELDDGTSLDVAAMLISVGRVPQTRGIGLEAAGVEVDGSGHIAVDGMLRTANPRIYAAGDCIGGLQLAHLATKEAERAAENALGHHPREIDRTVVPSCIYTHPNIAMVGLNTETAQAAGYRVRIGQARYLGNGKAWGEGETEGLVQLFSDEDSNLILGATIMGEHSVEIIHEVAVAMSDGLCEAELADVIHAHPTVSELVMDAAQMGEKVAPYLS
ncbi:MAG TPA: dihydrolipoyl dehydrogenase [Candidatus Dormibacteraeota bacterium]